MVALFKCGKFTSHSGLQLNWKIECDALSDDDWQGLACIASEILPPFGNVEGVPRGGLKFADALRQYITTGPLLICDDVCTTGNSMETFRNNRNAIGVVAFSRGISPGWIIPLFTLKGN